MNLKLAKLSLFLMVLLHLNACSLPTVTNDVQNRLQGRQHEGAEGGETTSLTTEDCTKSKRPVWVKFQSFTLNSDGSLGSEVSGGGKIKVNSNFVVRTQMLDSRDPSPRGIFSAYSDLTWTNQNGTPADSIIEFQWGKYAQLDFDSRTVRGSFKLKYDGQETKNAIAPVFANGRISYKTADLIKESLESIASVGKGNISVAVVNSASPSLISFGINFIGKLARKQIADTALTISKVDLFDVKSLSLGARISNQSFNPSNSLVASAGLKHNIANDKTSQITGPRFSEAPFGILASSNKLSAIGGMPNTRSDLVEINAFFVNTVDQLFFAKGKGRVTLKGSVTPSPVDGKKLGILLYDFPGKPANLTESQVCFIDSQIIVE